MSSPSHLTNTNCRNCTSPLTGNFCSNCGQPASLHRVDLHYIIHEIQHVLHFEKGILYTVKQLLINPGPSIQEFISKDRSRLMKPVIFIIITSLIYSTLEHFFHIEQGYMVQNGIPTDSAIAAIFNWIQSHYGYSNIMMALFIALWIKLLFRKYDYNLFEILIVLCFVMGIGMLIFSLFVVAEGLSGTKLMQIAGMIGVAYCTWSIGHFFNRKRVGTYFKALAAYLLGWITFLLAIVAVGLIVDAIRH